MHTLWYEFWNHFDAQIDFGKTFVTEKLVPWNHSYLKYALALHSYILVPFCSLKLGYLPYVNTT